MDEQQFEVKTTPESDQVKSRVSPSDSKNVILGALLAIVFLAVGIMIYLIARQAPTLETSMQKWMYPVFSGIVIGGLTTFWLYYQTTNGNKLDKEPAAWYFPVFGGALTLVLVSLAYIAIGMWPIGKESAMIVDMHHQYAPMLAQLRDMLLNGGSVLYTFEVGSGTSFIPLFAYYLASPFNFLLILFPHAFSMAYIINSDSPAPLK